VNSKDYLDQVVGYQPIDKALPGGASEQYQWALEILNQSKLQLQQHLEKERNIFVRTRLEKSQQALDLALSQVKEDQSQLEA
jgi:hypothetical protein